MKDTRYLSDLVSVGKATLMDFEILGITRVSQLKGRNAHRMYLKLQKLTGKDHDPCCEDVFRAAIEQANNPELPREQCKWPYWSKLRKGQIK